MTEQAQFSKLYHCVYALHYHLVMCTKYRKKCIDAVMLARVREIAATRCTGWGGSLLEFNGEADHVHLLVALPPNLDLSRFVNNLKTTSSRLLRKEFADRLKMGLSQVRILVPLVLHHHVWWGAAIDPETVHRATTQPRLELGAPHLQPSTRRALPGALGAKGVAAVSCFTDNLL